MSAVTSRQKCLMLHVSGNQHESNEQDSLCVLGEVAKLFHCPLCILDVEIVGLEQLESLTIDLKRHSEGHQRNVLLIAGFYLENQISVCALHALAEGYDVHLLADLIVANDAKFAPALQLRLLQAGVVPSSLRQILYFWKCTETDPKMLEGLTEFQEKYSGSLLGRPA